MTPVGSRRLRCILGLLILAAGVYAITSIPYFLAVARTPPGMTVSDVLVWQEDQDAYFSFIRQAADGHWLFINRLTYLEHRPAFFNLEWLLVGRVMALFQRSTFVAYQVWRAAGALAIVCGFYALARRVLRTPMQRRVALFLCVFGGVFQTVFLGWNWISASAHQWLGWHLGSLSTDFHYYSTQPFAQILTNPHFALPLGVFMLALAAYLEGESTSRWTWYAIAGVLGAMEGLMRPYEMIVFYSVIPLFIGVESLVLRSFDLRKALCRLLPLLVAAPALLYSIYIFKFHPIFKYWASQGVDNSTPILDTLAHMGFAGVLLAIRLCFLKRFPLTTSSERFVLCWLFTVMFLIHGTSLPLMQFMPYSPQLITGLMPSVILLGAAIFDPAAWPGMARRPIVWSAILVAVVVVHALDDIPLMLSLTPLGRPGEVEAYIPSTAMEGYAWLDSHASEDDVVLCIGRSGHKIGKFASVRVVCGHWSVTPHAEKIDALARRFYKGSMSAEEAAQFLKDCGASWIYFGRPERRLGAMHPELMPGFTEHVVNDEVIVYSSKL